LGDTIVFGVADWATGAAAGTGNTIGGLVMSDGVSSVFEGPATFAGVGTQGAIASVTPPNNATGTAGNVVLDSINGAYNNAAAFQNALAHDSIGSFNLTGTGVAAHTTADILVAYNLSAGGIAIADVTLTNTTGASLHDTANLAPVVHDLVHIDTTTNVTLANTTGASLHDTANLAPVTAAPTVGLGNFDAHNIWFVGSDPLPVANPDSFSLNDTVDSTSLLLGNVLTNDTNPDPLDTQSVVQAAFIGQTFAGAGLAGLGTTAVGGLSVASMALGAGEIAHFSVTPTGVLANEASPIAAEVIIGANGSVTLIKNNAFDFLPNGETLTLHFTDGITESDNLTGTPVSTTLDVTITGTATNDVFVLNAGATATGGVGNDTIYAAGSATIKAGLGTNTITFAGSGNDIINQGGTDTLTDNGTNNTIALPLAGQGLDTIHGSVLSNGDTFDLRSALAATTWDQQLSDIGNYLTLGTSGSNALVQISVTSGGTPITVAILGNAGSVSLSTFIAHSLLT
jgi:hypothetical protein